MSQKTEKPVLSGQRIKTRKRDEKEKYDPGSFRDAVVLGINQAGPDLDQVTKYLDTAGSKLDYRRYAETLHDILFAGGILAPGGSLLEDGDKIVCSDTCVFKAGDEYADIKAYYEVFYKLIRRYKYLEKSFSEELKKLILFLKGFGVAERRRLGVVIGIALANGLGNAECLRRLFEEHLVKEGLALAFATNVFEAWLREKDITHIASTLKRAGLEGTLLNLLPVNKRTLDNFEQHFSAAGLDAIVDYQRSKATLQMKRGLQQHLAEMIKDDEPVKEMVIWAKEYMQRNAVLEHEAAVMAWNCVMNAVEWNKKEELVAEQTLKHLKQYMPLFVALSTTPRSELALLQKIQEYCYDNMNFMKVFQKIVVLFYKSDVLSEDVVLHWYREGHVAKGKSIFLQQIKPFIDWLNAAEEEDSDEEED